MFFKKSASAYSVRLNLIDVLIEIRRIHSYQTCEVRTFKSNKLLKYFLSLHIAQKRFS